MLQWLVSKTNGPSFYIESPKEPIDSSSNITVNCFSDSAKSRALPCKFTWYRFNNNTHHAINNIRGNTYVCDAGDIGSVIKVEICSLDNELQGTKILEFGPIRVSVSTRKRLEEVLQQGQVVLSAKVLEESKERDVEVRISNCSIRIKDVKKNSIYKFESLTQELSLELNPREPTKLSIKFGATHLSDLKKLKEGLSLEKISNNCLELKLPRQNRDLLYLSQRCFSNKATVITHIIQLLNSPTTSSQIHSLKNYISDLQTTNQRLIKESESLKSQLNSLSQHCNMKQNLSSSIVTVMTDNNLLQKFQSLKLQKSQIMNQMKVLQIDNLRLSQKGSMSRISIDDKQKQKEIVAYLKNQNKQLIKELSYYRRIHKEISQDTILSDLFDGASEVSSCTKSSVKFQGNSISRIPLNFGSRVSASSLECEMKERKNSLFKKKTEIFTSKVNNQSSLESCELKQVIKKLKMELETSKNNYTILSLQHSKLKLTLKQQQQALKQAEKSKRQLEKNVQANVQASFETNKLFQHKRQQIVEGYQMRIKELKDQIDIIQSNQEILNRSRSIESDYDIFKSQENNILKQQNTMLMEQNTKLAKICERYLNEAKETTKLRGEIIRLNKEALDLKESLHRGGNSKGEGYHFKEYYN